MNAQDIRRFIGTAPTTMNTATTAASGTALAVALLLALPPAALGAQAPKVYFACYVPSSGTVYRIKQPDAPQQCGTSAKKGGQVQHIEFSWTDGAGALRVTDPAAGDLSGPLGSPTVAKLLGRALSATPPTDGQVLTWNQAANAWEAKAPPASGGTVDHGALTGLTDDDHAQYMLVDGVRNSINGFAVTGTLGQGNIPTQAQGARLMWYPAKAAFRAGWTANVTQTEDAVIGLHSIALGKEAGASGESSIALGRSQATGAHASAIGDAHANGEQSFAAGYAFANGARSVAIGNFVTANGEQSVALGSLAFTNGKKGAFVYGDASAINHVSALTDNHFVVRAGRFWFGNDNNVTATVGRFIETSTGAFLSSGGTWTNSSDSTNKSEFQEIDGDSLLARLAAIPVRTWRYRAEDSTVRHMGPTAQEFRAAFSLGDSDKAIATVDADGVSLAASQALLKRTDRLMRENDALRQANSELRSELRALEERTALIEAHLAQLARGSDTAVRR